MFKSLTLIAVAVATLVPAASFAAPVQRCHGPNGRFVRCPAASPTPAPAIGRTGNRCRLHGRFTSCSTPGAVHG